MEAVGPALSVPTGQRQAGLSFTGQIIFCFQKTALKDSPQGPPTANRQPLPTGTNCQPPTANF